MIEKKKSPSHPQCYKDKISNSKYTDPVWNKIGGLPDQTVDEPGNNITPGQINIYCFKTGQGETNQNKIE